MSEAGWNPCPFCGEEPIMKSAIFGYMKIRQYTLHCEHCGFNLGMRDSEKEAVELWNRRSKRENES